MYLRPNGAVLPGLRAMVVGEHDVPDVVLEVDHTTDVRRGKLLQYEAWGFPELWVEVPDWVVPSRPRRLADSRTRRVSRESESVLGGLGRGQNTSPVRATDFVALVRGLTIYLLGETGYEVAPESRAFSGWTATEIRMAMNETTPSALTCAVLERVGMAMGAEEGTGPDDDPLLRSQRRKGYNIGHAQGYAEGRAEGYGGGHVQGRAALTCGMLRSRGMDISAGFADALLEERAFAESSDVAVGAAIPIVFDLRVVRRVFGPPPKLLSSVAHASRRRIGKPVAREVVRRIAAATVASSARTVTLRRARVTAV